MAFFFKKCPIRVFVTLNYNSFKRILNCIWGSEVKREIIPLMKSFGFKTRTKLERKILKNEVGSH